MFPFRCQWGHRGKLFLCLTGLLALPSAHATGPVSTSYSQSAITTLFSHQSLFLEAYLNGVATHRILSIQLEQGQAYVTPSELAALNVRIPAGYSADERIPLGAINGLNYRIDHASQSIHIDVAPGLFHGQTLNAALRRDIPRAESHFGSVLNYDVYALRGLDSRQEEEGSRVSSFLDFRAFGNWGQVTQTGIVRNHGQQERVRLESYWSLSDVDSMTTYRLGDTVNGGLSWTRPIRLGGFQVQRNFQLRPDLITLPVPSASGTAVVPSTVDVFINNVRRYSEDVDSGPFVINDLPVVTGYGEARVVVRDALGREQVSVFPFYAASNLLSQGLWDFSLEAGFLRQRFGQHSNNYSDDPALTASSRYGLSNRLTLEAHAELDRDVENLGGGLVTSLGNAGILSADLAVSRFADDTGGQLGLTYQYRAQPFSLLLSTRHASDHYMDLASAMGSPTSERVNQLSLSYSDREVGSLGLSVIDISQNRMTAITGQPLQGCIGRFACIEPVRGESRLLALSYSRQFNSRLSLFSSVVRDVFSDRTSFSLGFSLPLTSSVNGLADFRYAEDEPSLTAQAYKPPPVEGRGVGWRVRKTSGEMSQGAAAVSYRSDHASVEVGVNEFMNDSEAFLDLRGSTVAMAGDFFLSNTIFDSFAVADVGVPGVTVLHENRPVGKTDDSGKLLVTGLNSYHPNRLAINPVDMAIDYQPSKVAGIVVPHERSGVRLDLKAEKLRSASLSLIRESGAPVPLGAELELHDDVNTHVVGYDGLVYLGQLRPVNHAFVSWEGGQCEAVFEYQEVEGAIPTIGPVTCYRMPAE